MWLKQVLIAIDQLANAILGGWADETLSARCWRLRDQQPWATFRRIVDTIFFWQKNHCRGSYISEVIGRQLPPRYRKWTQS